MPLVTDANGVASWIEAADLEAALRAAAGDTPDTAVAAGNPPAAAHGTTFPRPSSPTPTCWALRIPYPPRHR